MMNPCSPSFRPRIFYWLIFIAIFTGTMGTPFCFSDSLKQVISTSPSWNGFTNQDGTGLYHEILLSIFTPHHIKVVHKYTSAKRGLYLIKNDLADFYTCRPETDDSPGLVLGKYPMYEGRFYAIFKKERVKNWQGMSSLANRRVVWRRGYYRASDFKVTILPMETDSGTSALGQVVLGRGDFYIDDLNLINESIAKNKFPIDMNDYKIEPVGKRSYHPFFKHSKRGKTIMGLYDRGMETLHRSGKLKLIFEKWNHPYPAYEIH